MATAKTLVRLRRDDLVRLCEQRDLEPVGTKPQLAEALLLWRDRHANDFSSPSSTGTVRPASQRRRRRGKQSSASTITTDTPVLLRSEQIHTDEPRTPIRSKDREKEEELELDLESLGLEDREIAPEKLTKLEKIGSGGFKDVFIGKFRGRRIAISEFRGQLSQSMCTCHSGLAQTYLGCSGHQRTQTLGGLQPSQYRPIREWSLYLWGLHTNFVF